MGLLWADDSSGKQLQVRNAGRTLRLYVDGVLHTQYNPELPLTGSVWDHLALSALFAPPAAIERVLLLGLGGGAVVHLLRRYVQPREIVALELDERRIDLARRFFQVEQQGTRLVHADACQWVRDYQGPPFQLVIDDLFDEEGAEPFRAVAFDDAWCARLLRLLARPGWLVVNFAPRAALDAAVLLREQRHRRRFPSAFCFSDSRLENAVGAFCGLPSTSQALRRQLNTHPELGSARAKALMRFRIETLWR